MIRWCYFIGLLCLSTKGFTQSSTATGSWTTLNGKISGNEKWSGYVELQLRSLSLYNRFYYYELKGGATYSFNKNNSITLGTGLYNTFNEGPEFDDFSKQKEIRVWEQFIMEQQLSIIEIEHRYRIEQRFTDKYANRFRYRLNVSVPLNTSKMEPQTLYATAYNELFFTDKLPHFSRNRFMAGAGYILNEKISIQAGWLKQTDFLKNRERRKNYVFTSLSFKF